MPARLLVIEPNHAHAREMLDDELDARERGVGLRGACGAALTSPAPIGDVAYKGRGEFHLASRNPHR